MSLAFDRSFDPRHGEAVVLAPGVVRVTAPNVGPMTFQGTNTYLIGEQTLAIVDPGPANDEHLAALVRAVRGRPVTAVLLTHGHRDHDALAPHLQTEFGAPICAATSYGRSADGRLRDGDVVPGIEARVVALATPGHSSDHLAYALPDQGIVLTGDHVMGWATTVIVAPDGRIGDYLRSLDRLAERPENRFLPGHGDVVENGRPLLRGLRHHRRMREKAILERLRAGTSGLTGLVDELYRDLAPELRSAAALSVLAHLTDLAERKLVAAPDGVVPDGRFYAIDPSTLPA